MLPKRPEPFHPKWHRWIEKTQSKTEHKRTTVPRLALSWSHRPCLKLAANDCGGGAERSSKMTHSTFDCHFAEQGIGSQPVASACFLNWELRTNDWVRYLGSSSINVSAR